MRSKQSRAKSKEARDARRLLETEDKRAIKQDENPYADLHAVALEVAGPKRPKEAR